jgi:hypothetical protein
VFFVLFVYQLLFTTALVSESTKGGQAQYGVYLQHGFRPTPLECVRLPTSCVVDPACHTETLGR